MSSMPSPSIQVENGKYLVSFVHPDNGQLYVFDQDMADSTLSLVDMLKITLPPAYASSDFRLGYTNGYVTVISRLAGQWWASCIEVNTGNIEWTKT